jgi:hypothetical protein
MDEAENMDEMDLDELLAELDDEMKKEGEEMTEAEEEEVEAEETEKVEGEDEEIDLEEMSEEDLKSFIEDVIADMVEAGELEAGEEFEAEDEMDSDEEIDIDVEDDSEEIMEGDKEEVEEGIIDKLKSMYNDEELLSKIVTVDGKKVSMKDLLSLAASGASGGMAKSGAGKSSSIGETEMEDMMEEVNALRAELHEVNLLNAKLLYTNKIFRAKNLKEAQKVKVLEAFDKAANVKEVKLVFETLNEGMTAKTATPIKENLGRASKAAGVAASTPIVDIDPQFARMQKLAGIR